MARATKEEQFLMKLLEMSSEESDVDCYSVGKALGLKEHAVDMTVKQLAQANFIKKRDETLIFMTQHGVRIAEQIKQEWQ